MNPAGAAGGGAARDLLFVDGMFCAACAATVEARLGRLPGVESCAVDLGAGAAALQWAPGREDPGAVRTLVEGLGYRVRSLAEPEPADGTAPARSLRMRLAVALFFGMWTMLPSIALYLDAAPNAAVAHGLALGAAIASLPVVAWSGQPFYRMAFRTLRGGAPGIDALVAIGVAGAVLLSLISLAGGGAEVYFEVAVALVTLQLLARLVDLDVARAGRGAVARLLDLAPPRVQRFGPDGRTGTVPVAEVGAGDLVRIEAGDTLAVDGEVEDGQGEVDRSMLTGETIPVAVATGDALHAGEVLLTGVLRLRVSASAGKRRLDALGRRARALLLGKAPWQRGVDLLARNFLLLSSLAAIAGAALVIAAGGSGNEAAVRALAVFVVACPCALSLAAPIAGLCAARRAAQGDMLLRDLRAITGASRVDTLFVDKTGTLTEGRPGVSAVHPCPGVDAGDVLDLAARAEAQARHPLAGAILEAAGAAGRSAAPGDRALVQTLPGLGVRLDTPEGPIRVGSGSWFDALGLRRTQLPDAPGTRVWVALGEQVLGAVDLEDRVRPGAAEALATLQAAGIRVVMISGDAEGPVRRLADALGIEGRAGCSPEDKVDAVLAAQRAGATVAFAGDGLNDGPALAAADLGVAVEGALDAARTASSVTLVRGGVERLPALFRLTDSARRVLHQNLLWALAYNACAVPAALAGWVHPAVAAVAMAASSLSVVLNGLRIRAPAQ